MIPKHKKAQSFSSEGLFANLSSFAELEGRISRLRDSDTIGAAFEVFAEAYFNTQALYQAEEVWPEKKLPQDLRIKLGIPMDAGVDGVSRTNSGLYKAYQVKFRTNRTALTWDKDGLGKFFGQTDRVDERILFTNSIDLSHITKTRIDFCSIKGNDLDKLDKSDFEAIENWLKTGLVIRAEPKEPYLYQEEAINDISQELSVNDRAAAIMACATGKTLVALWVAEKKDAQTILVLLPSLALVRQTLRDWAKENNWNNFNYLCVCSDITVINDEDNDEIILNKHDLDFSVTTQKEKIELYLQSKNNSRKIIFSTYQSCKIVAEAMPQGFSFDLAIFDEAHKTASRQGANYAFALQDKNLLIKKRLFLTATPRHYNINKKDKEGDQRLVFSMDDQEVYGKIAHQLSFRDAVKKNIICDYKIIISTVTSEMINRELLRQGEVLVKGEKVKAERIANILAIRSAVDKYGIKRIFSFHNSVQSAKSFTANSNEGIGAHLKDFKTLHVNGKMSTSKRDALLEEFKESDKAIISNARCLTEGVDVPVVDMVAFVSPKKSKVDIVQAAGRAMRKAPGKELGYILIPLFVQQTENETIEQALEKTKFNTVWDVLQAMQEQDESLVEIIGQMKEELGRTLGYNDNRLREKVEVLGTEVCINALRTSITTKIIDKLASNWDERFGEILRYKSQYGDCNVVASDIEYPGLCGWVRKQRVKKNSGELLQAYIDKLNSIDFVFDPFDAAFEEMFVRLLGFKKDEGHCSIPRDYADKKLSSWVTTQRYVKRQGLLAENRLKRLEKEGFIWDPRTQYWEDMFLILLGYRNEHNHCDVPDKYIYNSHQLGIWVGNQRTNKMRGALDHFYIKRLDDIGFDWNPLETQFNTRFNNYFPLWRQFQEKGDIWNDNGATRKDLLKWANKLRSQYKKGSLKLEYQNKMNSIEFDWDPMNNTWEKMFTELCEFKKINGHFQITRKNVRYKKLATWVQEQRTQHKQNNLDQKRVDRLNNIGFAWGPKNDVWQKRFSELERFKEINGHCNVPANYSENRPLGSWVSNQRTDYKQNRLKQDRIDKLNSIGFVWNTKNAK
jgi:superfamily II DNA or RNA helicase